MRPLRGRTPKPLRGFRAVATSVKGPSNIAMYIRFVIHEKDMDSGKRQGIFQTLVDVREEGLLYDFEIRRVKAIHDWFDKNLKRPVTLSKSSKPHALNKAISWFKDSATEHIQYMRELAAILEEHDIGVDIIQTTRPGYVVYEDVYQITAEPFSDPGA